MPFDSHAFTANAVAYHEEGFARRKSACRESVRVNARACEPRGSTRSASPTGRAAFPADRRCRRSSHSGDELKIILAMACPRSGS